MIGLCQGAFGMNKSNVKTAPFIHGSEVSLNLHLDLLIGLLSVMIISVVQNGFRVLSICLFSAFAAWLTETLGQIITRRHGKTDFRSLAMGLIIAMLCPVTIPLWVPVSASVISVLFVRIILGPNYKTLFMTPVIAWIYMLTVAPMDMTSYPANRFFNAFPPFENINREFYLVTDSIAQQLQSKQVLTYNFLDIFTGNYPGGMGTTCIFIILAVCVYFIFRRSMAWQVSLSMIITVSIFALLFNRTSQSPLFSVLYELSATSYIFVAVFVAGDLINTPTLVGAKIVFGALVGIFTMTFRYIGLAEYCVPFSLLICNLFCEMFDVLFLYIQIFFLRKRMIKK